MLDEHEELVERLRKAGCVFAEDEARIIAALPEGEREDAVRRRVAGEPLEHIVGWVDFGGVRLSVGPGVFVPRQRTLLLASLAVERAAELRGAVVVEAYAGVAPITATLARRVASAHVHAADSDPRALEHARRNGVRAHRTDVLDGLPDDLLGAVDVIAAVPPYVPTEEADLLPREAREHEPLEALLAGTDGLDGVRRLLDGARAWLRDGGHLLIEMGRGQMTDAVLAARADGYDVVLHAGDDGQTAVLEAVWSPLRVRLRAALRSQVLWPPELEPDGRFEEVAQLAHSGAAVRMARRLGDPPVRVAQSALVQGVASRLWSILLVPAVTHGVMPHPGTVVATDDDGSVRLGVRSGPALGDPSPDDVRDAVIAVLAPLVEATPLSNRLLWGNVAASLAVVPRV